MVSSAKCFKFAHSRILQTAHEKLVCQDPKVGQAHTLGIPGFFILKPIQIQLLSINPLNEELNCTLSCILQFIGLSSASLKAAIERTLEHRRIVNSESLVDLEFLGRKGTFDQDCDEFIHLAVDTSVCCLPNFKSVNLRESWGFLLATL